MLKASIFYIENTQEAPYACIPTLAPRPLTVNDMHVTVTCTTCTSCIVTCTTYSDLYNLQPTTYSDLYNPYSDAQMSCCIFATHALQWQHAVAAKSY